MRYFLPDSKPVLKNFCKDSWALACVQLLIIYHQYTLVRETLASLQLFPGSGSWFKGFTIEIPLFRPAKTGSEFQTQHSNFSYSNKLRQCFSTWKFFSYVLGISTELPLTSHFESWKRDEYILSLHKILFSLISLDIKPGWCSKKLACRKLITFRNVTWASVIYCFSTYWMDVKKI